MHRLNHPSARRSALVLAGLALFLLGTNYCLVGAIAGADRMPMACMMPPAADADASPAGHCHGKASDDDAGAPPPTLPCCVAFAPVVAPAVAFGDAGALPLVGVVVTDAFVSFDAPAASGHLLRAPPDGPPPDVASRAPLSSRAPPLA